MTKCFALSGFPANATAADIEEDEDDLTLHDLADLLHENNTLELRDVTSIEECVTMDNAGTLLLRIKEGQSDATESAGDGESGEEQKEKPCLITSDKQGRLKWPGELTNLDKDDPVLLMVADIKSGKCRNDSYGKSRLPCYLSLEI